MVRVPLETRAQANFLSREKLSDIYQVFTDCVKNRTPALYYPVPKEAQLRHVRLSVVSPGKKLKNEMIESYRERHDEDLELERKLRAFEVDLIAFKDT